jgi:acetyltransferase
MSSQDPITDVEAIDVTLRDGRHVTVRAVREEDKDRFQDAVRSLSSQSSYYRFFSPMRELSPKLLERATHPEPERELQLVAVTGGGPHEKIIGGARYVAIAGTGDCEFSIAIVDEWQRFGLARPLLATLIELARERGFERMDGYVLATNVRMLALAERLDFTVMPSSEGPTVRLVRRDLRAAP